MFNFETELAEINDVPQQYRGLYSKKEDGTGFALDADLAKKLDVSGLTSALDKERKANKSFKELVGKWTGLGFESPDAVSAKIAELQEAATKGADGKANFDKLKANLEEGHKKVIEAKDGELKTMRGTLEKYLVQNEAIQAITEEKGVPVLLLPHIMSSVKVLEDKGEFVVRVVDSEGDPRGDGKGGFMTIKDLVKEMKGSKDFGRAFESSGTNGGGKPPASSNKGSEAGRNTGELSPIEKIKAGIAKGQLRR